MLALGVTLVVVATASIARPAPKPKGGRMLGIAVNENPRVNFDTAFQAAKRTGFDMVSLPIAWDSIETSPGKYAADPNYLAIANLFYPASGVRVALELNPIDTNNLRLPNDLQQKSFADPLVVQRFKLLLDYVFAQLPALHLVALTIGNEVDGYLHTPGLRTSYIHFLQQVIPYAKSKRGGLQVGVKSMFAGVTGTGRHWLKRLNSTTDVIMVTYYPFAEDFSVAAPDVVARDLRDLVAIYPSKPIYLSEIGYPSGSRVGSSETLQARFIRSAFRAWDQHADRIKLMEFTWLHDQSPAAIEYFQRYYGISDPRFVEFLSTLGLRRYDGTDKPAFRELIRQAKQRGW